MVDLLNGNAHANIKRMNKQLFTTIASTFLLGVGITLVIWQNIFVAFPAGVLAWQAWLLVISTLIVALSSLLVYWLVYKNKKSAGNSKEKSLMLGSIYALCVFVVNVVAVQIIHLVVLTINSPLNLYVVEAISVGVVIAVVIIAYFVTKKK